MTKEHDYYLPDGRPMPLSNIKWIPREDISPNEYNPNSVATPEMKLLKRSIMEDGWTQPIVINPDFIIVDGFHRWTTSGDPEVYAMTGGYVPTVMLQPLDESHKRMSTIRHNRARGRHNVLSMGNIVGEMINEGMTVKEVMERLQMEREEVIRLVSPTGILDSEQLKQDYSKSWIPDRNSR